MFCHHCEQPIKGTRSTYRAFFKKHPRKEGESIGGYSKRVASYWREAQSGLPNSKVETETETHNEITKIPPE